MFKIIIFILINLLKIINIEIIKIYLLKVQINNFKEHLKK